MLSRWPPKRGGKTVLAAEGFSDIFSRLLKCQPEAGKAQLQIEIY
jgi:hypothetical protein